MRSFEKLAGAAPKGIVFAGALGLLLVPANTSRGDSVSIGNPTAITSPVDLTAGTNDWAHYAISSDTTSNGDVGMVFDHPASTNFSNVSGVNGGLGAYDVTDPTAPLLTWTGGTPDATGSSHSWVFNSNNFAAGAGLSITYPVSPGQTILKLYVNAYTDAVLTPLPVELQASLSSGANAQNTSNLPAFWGNGTTQDGDYTIGVTNTSSAAETLTVTFSQRVSQNGPSGNGSNPGIFGVTATTIVPEPVGFGLLTTTAMATLMRRRRRHRA
jgi:hypothetical protein